FTFTARTALAFIALALAARIGLLEPFDAHGQKAQHVFVDLELALELEDRLRWRVEVQKNVVAFAVLLDAEGERAQAPIFLLLDFPAFSFDDRLQVRGQ